MSDLSDDIRDHFNHELTDQAAWKLESMEDDIEELEGKLMTAEQRRDELLAMLKEPTEAMVSRARQFLVEDSYSNVQVALQEVFAIIKDNAL